MKADNKIIILIVYFLLSIAVFILFDFANSPDFQSYLNWYESSVNASYLNTWVLLKDPGYYFISNFSYYLSLGVLGVIFVLFTISISTKMFVAYRFLNAEMFFWFGVLYLSRLFIIHDLIQYRAGAAIGLCFLSFFFYLKAYRLRAGGIFLFAVSIHLSSILILVVIPLHSFLMKRQNANLFNFIIVAFILSFIVVLIDPYRFLMELMAKIPFLQERIAPYIDGSYQTSAIPLLNTYVLIKIIVFIFFLRWIYLNQDKELVRKNHLLYLSFFISYFSLVLGWFFRGNDSLAIRLSDFYCIYDILFFVLAMNVFTVSSKPLYRLFILISAIIFIYSSAKLIFH
ncbi:EpsG family protein [Pantoea ananatis]|uniref:EpsG family protein n=1 Tax=Pantoea ananas TaxID=553 RepID=UPI0004972670|nr:EpsG family protein [Pantoea ananatis]MDF7790943.1 EpsG family protein [Pantoea ananatis]